MAMKEIPRRIVWRVMRLVGLGRYSWNLQYKAGKWCDRKRSPHTVALIQEFCKGGRLVEFGCGDGMLPHLLQPGTFSDYLGLDISDKAVEIARNWAREARLCHCTFEQANMASWPGSEGIALIVAEECLNYLQSEDLERFLRRCCASLAENGKILVIVHSADKHAATLAVCRRVCRLVDERWVTPSGKCESVDPMSWRGGERQATGRAYLVFAPKATEDHGKLDTE